MHFMCLFCFNLGPSHREPVDTRALGVARRQQGGGMGNGRAPPVNRNSRPGRAAPAPPSSILPARAAPPQPSKLIYKYFSYLLH